MWAEAATANGFHDEKLASFAVTVEIQGTRRLRLQLALFLAESLGASSAGGTVMTGRA